MWYYDPYQRKRFWETWERLDPASRKILEAQAYRLWCSQCDLQELKMEGKDVKGLIHCMRELAAEVNADLPAGNPTEVNNFIKWCQRTHTDRQLGHLLSVKARVQPTNMDPNPVQPYLDIHFATIGWPFEEKARLLVEQQEQLEEQARTAIICFSDAFLQ